MNKPTVPMLPEQRDAWAKVEALKGELLSCKITVSECESRLAQASERIRALCDNYGRDGEITWAVKEAESAGKPKIGQGDYAETILRIEGRWIVTGRCGHEAFYDRTTGQKKGTRSDWKKIDAAKALALWAEYEARLKAEGVGRENPLAKTSDKPRCEAGNWTNDHRAPHAHWLGMALDG